VTQGCRVEARHVALAVAVTVALAVAVTVGVADPLTAHARVVPLPSRPQGCACRVGATQGGRALGESAPPLAPPPPPVPLLPPQEGCPPGAPLACRGSGRRGPSPLAWRRGGRGAGGSRQAVPRGSSGAGGPGAARRGRRPSCTPSRSGGPRRPASERPPRAHPHAPAAGPGTRRPPPANLTATVVCHAALYTLQPAEELYPLPSILSPVGSKVPLLCVLGASPGLTEKVKAGAEARPRTRSLGSFWGPRRRKRGEGVPRRRRARGGPGIGWALSRRRARCSSKALPASAWLSANGAGACRGDPGVILPGCEARNITAKASPWGFLATPLAYLSHPLAPL